MSNGDGLQRIRVVESERGALWKAVEAHRILAVKLGVHGLATLRKGLEGEGGMEPRQAQSKGLDSKADHSGSLSRPVAFGFLACVWCLEQRFLSSCCSALTVVREEMK